MLARPVQEIAIKVVRAQPFQTSLTRCDYALSRRVVRIHLTDDVDFFACGRRVGHRAANHFFSSAVAIHFCRINQGYATLNCGFDHRDFRLRRRRALAHAPGADAEAGDWSAVGAGRDGNHHSCFETGIKPGRRIQQDACARLCRTSSSCCNLVFGRWRKTGIRRNPRLLFRRCKRPPRLRLHRQ